MTTAAFDDNKLVALLSSPDAYPWRPASVEVIETHISWVFLAGERVVKVKRPVTFPFVDHSSVQLRRHSCEEETILNRRLTDEVYLGVVPITRTEQGLEVDGEGEPIEWATLMRRLPADRMLDRLLIAGAAPQDLADRLARRLVPFHLQRAESCGGLDYGSAPALASVLTDNLDELHAFSGVLLGRAQLALVDEAMRVFLVEHAQLLAQRVVDGWIRNGHGDLRPEHICLEGPDRVEIYDCIEFNPALRCADVASDLAFLLMELERFGAGAVARTLVQRYRAEGVALPPALLRLYSAHRALVRAKVNCLTLQNEHQAHPGLRDEIQTYLNLASRAAITVRPCLIAMTGLSGTGKSTVAVALAEAIGATIHSSDSVRKELANVSGEASAGWNEGIYSSDWTDRTYRRLIELAAQDLASGSPVILDATFLDLERRLDVARVGQDVGVPTLFIETVAEERVVADRLAARAARHDSPSDATIETYRRQRDAAATLTPVVPDGAEHAIVDTSLSGPGLLDPVFSALVSRHAVVPRVRETA